MTEKIDPVQAVNDLADEALGNGNSWEEWCKPRLDVILAALTQRPEVQTPDDTDRQYATSLADAVENCRVTCRHEPSAFDLEQQGYNTIIRALRLFAPQEELPNEERLTHIVSGALRACVKDHGTTVEGSWIGSATKRIVHQIMAQP